VDNSLTRQYGGSGLGLALVRQLAELHGGSVSVESELGKGSVFSLSLPYRSEDGSSEEATGDVGAAEAEQATTVGACVLIVDDDLPSLRAVGDYLQARGYRVLTASSGAEAMALAHEHKPDVILMDVQMPGMDGVETTRRLRTTPDLGRTPIIALTASAMPGDRERFLAAGMNAWVSKPVSLRRLVQTMESMLAPGQ
jgi:CheY-like chemotaxis protein